jgi:rhodanese-related sulfurtransferase
VSENIGEDPVQAAKRQIEEVTPEQVLDMRAKEENFVLLDVREPKEWNLGHLPKAIHIPLGNLQTRVGDSIPRDRRVVVYCARGNRSALAALTMKRMGYDKVASMSRGIMGWADINGEIEE